MHLPPRARLLAITMGEFLVTAGTLYAIDCNGNGIGDASDLLPRNFGFLAAPSYAGRGPPFPPMAAARDGDAGPDLATANPDSNTVSVLLNQGNGTFRIAVSSAVGLNPLCPITAALNREGN